MSRAARGTKRPVHPTNGRTAFEPTFFVRGVTMAIAMSLPRFGANMGRVNWVPSPDTMRFAAEGIPGALTFHPDSPAAVDLVRRWGRGLPAGLGAAVNGLHARGFPIEVRAISLTQSDAGWRDALDALQVMVSRPLASDVADVARGSSLADAATAGGAAVPSHGEAALAPGPSYHLTEAIRGLGSERHVYERSWAVNALTHELMHLSDRGLSVNKSWAEGGAEALARAQSPAVAQDLRVRHAISTVQPAYGTYVAFVDGMLQSAGAPLDDARGAVRSLLLGDNGTQGAAHRVSKAIAARNGLGDDAAHRIHNQLVSSDGSDAALREAQQLITDLRQQGG